MKKQFSIVVILIYCVFTAGAQKKRTYEDAITVYQKNYIITHEVVKGNNRKFFRFYPPNAAFKLQCRFELSTDTAVITMRTSGKTIPQKDFTWYGSISFTIHDTLCRLKLFRSLPTKPPYQNYLFIPFTDLTTADETYGSGRYIDILTTDIKNDTVEIDFNKAYNPYCAYTTGYNCPIPPKENYVPVAVKAGEKTFAKSLVH